MRSIKKASIIFGFLWIFLFCSTESIPFGDHQGVANAADEYAQHNWRRGGVRGRPWSGTRRRGEQNQQSEVSIDEDDEAPSSGGEAVEEEGVTTSTVETEGGGITISPVETGPGEEESESIIMEAVEEEIPGVNVTGPALPLDDFFAIREEGVAFYFECKINELFVNKEELKNPDRITIHGTSKFLNQCKYVKRDADRYLLSYGNLPGVMRGGDYKINFIVRAEAPEGDEVATWLVENMHFEVLKVSYLLASYFHDTPISITCYDLVDSGEGFAKCHVRNISLLDKGVLGSWAPQQEGADAE